jgi:hypothetical protein
LQLASWLVVLLSTAILCFALDIAGCDARVYQNTVANVHTESSPYASAIVRLEENHAKGTKARTFNYLYPPLTLPFVRAAAVLPLWLSSSIYVVAYFAFAFTTPFFEQQLFAAGERAVFSVLAPLCVFFPGLLNDETLTTGNIAYILMGLIVGAAFYGWKRDRWLCFYAAVLLASSFKPPMLTLLAIPVFSAAKQWLGACATGIIGVVAFLAQRRLWPGLFRDYLQMLDLTFRYNKEFGFSPAGLLAQTLHSAALPYSTASTLLYLCYAAAILCVLFAGARRYREGLIDFSTWIPVMMLGVLLLNPRIKQYDIQALTLPMALLLWRAARRLTQNTRTAVMAALAVFTVTNILILVVDVSEPVEMILMLSLFAFSAGGVLNRAAQQAAAV